MPSMRVSSSVSFDRRYQCGFAHRDAPLKSGGRNRPASRSPFGRARRNAFAFPVRPRPIYDINQLEMPQGSSLPPPKVVSPFDTRRWRWRSRRSAI
jgi:hypothetical protein